MARIMLTDKAVEKAKPPAKGRAYLWDALVPSFALRVTDRGHRSWIIQRRVNGKMLRVTLGDYPALGLGDARDAARMALKDMTKGITPAKRKRPV